MKKIVSLSLLSALFLLSSCEFFDFYFPRDRDRDDEGIVALEFVGEQVIPDDALFDGSVIGGLSSIDYAGGIYYIISDAPNAPIRFYQATLDFDNNVFNAVEIINQVELLKPDGMPFDDNEADPEAIRFDPYTGKIVWTSEGYVDDRGVDPFIREATVSGDYVRDFTIPELFLTTDREGEGPRNNGTFEGLSNSYNDRGYWTSMELPLIQDGPAPIFGEDTDSPVRIAYINRFTGRFGRQFAYELDPVAREGGFTVNGVVEILEYARNQFLVLERSFSTGYEDGGNDVKIYDVDANNATNIASMESLQDANYRPARKKLLFDFEDIRAQLSTLPDGTANIVDNIEGITFGPKLPNGNRSLVLVADNNFSAFGAQLNQFIVFEVIED